MKQIIPGLCLAIVVVAAAMASSAVLAELLPFERNPVSPILLAIVFGIAISSTFNLSARFRPGIKFGMKELLRFGIVLMGIRLSIFSAL